MFGENCRIVLRFMVVLLAAGFLSLAPDPCEGSWTSIVGTTQTETANSLPFQRKSFQGHGRYWTYYCDGQNMVYNSSPDGGNWSSSSETIRPCGLGEQFSIWFDGTLVHYAFAEGKPGFPIYYRSGTPKTDGTIAWLTPEQIAVPAALGITSSIPCLSVDSLGFPWIGYRRVEGVNKSPMVTKSQKDGGTWLTAPGFPYDLAGWTAAAWVVVPIPLTHGKMLALYTSSGHYVRSRVWKEGTWTNRVMNPNPKIGVSSPYCSAVAQGDDVHFAFLSSTSLMYTKYSLSSNSWAPEIRVQPFQVTPTSAPILTLDAKGGPYLFWAGAPKSNRIYFLKHSGGKWDASSSELVDETLNKLSSNSALTSFYQTDSGPALFYLGMSTKPFQVKFSSGRPPLPALSLKITSPSDGAFVPKSEVKVEGQLSNSSGKEIGVFVNGIWASLYDDRFVANRVPIKEGPNPIIAMAIDRTGKRTETSIVVHGLKSSGYLKMRANVEYGSSPLEATLTLESSLDLSRASLGYTGPGEVEWLSASTGKYRVRMKIEGVYEFRADISDPAGNIFDDSAVITVIDGEKLEKTLHEKWKAVADALKAGNIDGALSHFAPGAQGRYRQVFKQMGSEQLRAVFSDIKEIKLESFGGRVAECEAIREEGGKEYSYPVTFMLGEDGVWRIMGF